jgi:hypothetical protein
MVIFLFWFVAVFVFVEIWVFLFDVMLIILLGLESVSEGFDELPFSFIVGEIVAFFGTGVEIIDNSIMISKISSHKISFKDKLIIWLYFHPS